MDAKRRITIACTGVAGRPHYHLSITRRDRGDPYRSAFKFSETSMVHLLVSILVVGVSVSVCFAEDNDTRLTLLNTQDHDVVVGVYTPLNGGIEESLFALPRSTAIEDIRLPIIESERFAIVYRAQAVDGKILRVKPIKIIGTARICIVNRENRPFAIIQYRGDEQRPERSWSKQIVSPEDEQDAELIKKEVARAKRIKNTTKFSPETR